MTDTCPICSISLRSFDDDASAFHVNQCLDGGGPAGPASGHDRAPRSCPVCSLELAENVQIEDHVEACLLAQSGSPNNATRSESRGSDASEACPSCLQDWEAMGVPLAARDEHVVECLAQRQALAGDGSDAELDVVDDNDNKLDKNQLRALLSSNGLQNGFGKLKSTLKDKVRGDSSTLDLIPQLSLLLQRSFASGKSATRSATLCTPNAMHIRSQPADFGWGCGYRNAQMAFSALRHESQYQHLFLADSSLESSKPEELSRDSDAKRKKAPPPAQLPDIPSIRELQEMVESAWKTGFDPEGKKHFKGKLIGSRRWIGTSEVYVMLTWLGVRLTMVDFPRSKGKQKEGLHGAHRALTEWVFDYFSTPLDEDQQEHPASKDAFSTIMASKGSPIRIAHDRLPLYLQHQGHSRTIIGVEVTKNGDHNLLLFDPGHAVPKELRSAALQSAQAHLTGESSAKKAKTGASSAQLDLADYNKLLSPFRVNLKSLSKKDEYQILRIETAGGSLSADEKLQRRILSSLQIES